MGRKVDGACRVVAMSSEGSQLYGNKMTFMQRQIKSKVHGYHSWKLMEALPEFMIGNLKF